MRIAYVTEAYPPDINGVALTVQRTVNDLRRRGHVVEVIRPRQCGEPRGKANNEWLSSGCALPMYREVRFGWASPRLLAAHLEAMQAELVHVATPGPLGCLAVTAANRLGIPTSSDFRTHFDVYSRHYGLGWLEPAIGAYLRWFHNRTGCSFVPTQQARQALQSRGFDHLCVVGRGVDLARFSPRQRDPALRASWSPAGAPILLHVGRLAAEKNVELALQAARRAPELVPGTRLIVVGDGPRRRALERAYPEAIFLGMQTGNQLAKIYASADAFLFPSLSDTFGNVVLEALASGLPVVAFDTAAPSEYVVDGINGRLVEPGNSDAFVRATCDLVQFGAERLAAARQSARLAVLGATWPSVLDQFEDLLLETVVAQRPIGKLAAHAGA
jgi:glycosyltransferase involved in cell wall biosynthesis